MNNYGFDPDAYAAFEEAALEQYDFRTCQRSDGSYYGTGGQCRKGTETDKVEKENFSQTRKKLQAAADAYTADGTKEEKIYKEVRAEAVKKASSIDPEIESKHKELLELEKKFYKTKNEKDFNKLGKADEELDKRLDSALKKGESQESKKSTKGGKVIGDVELKNDDAVYKRVFREDDQVARGTTKLVKQQMKGTISRDEAAEGIRDLLEGAGHKVGISNDDIGEYVIDVIEGRV